MTRFLSALALPFLAACHVGFHDHVTVDGVRLSAEHEEVLTLESWPVGGLSIQAHRGDVRVERATGPTTITVQVLEREQGEAHAHIEEGRLVARATNGAKCAIGRVLVRTDAAPGGLELATGMGDVRVEGVQVSGRLKLTTGMGDVDVRAAGEPSTVELASGMGDISATELRCTRFRAETGMGDVSVDGLEASEQAELSSGMGDVEIERSKGARVKADTGLGDVDLVESSFVARELDTGLGRVRER
jgi:DUF4097 and DUF4098 domain-containing protein YvlB